MIWGISSGSSLFAKVPIKGFPVNKGLIYSTGKGTVYCEVNCILVYLQIFNSSGRGSLLYVCDGLHDYL